MSSAKPTRKQADLADVLELILDKGIVINADIAITVGQTEMIGVEIRAAIASFETAAEYGLAFPSGTDMRRVEQASGREPLEEGGDTDLGIDASSVSQSANREPPSRRPDPSIPLSMGENADEGDETGAEASGDDEESEEPDAGENEAGDNSPDEDEQDEP